MIISYPRIPQCNIRYFIFFHSKENVSAGIMDTINYCISDPSKLYRPNARKFINYIQMGHHPFSLFKNIINLNIETPILLCFYMGKVATVK